MATQIEAGGRKLHLLLHPLLIKKKINYDIPHHQGA